MVRQDYADSENTAKTPSRKKNTHRNKKCGRKPGIFRLTVTAIILLGFIGGLWFISHNGKQDPRITMQRKAQKEGIPPKPEERWQYIKELENRHLLPVPSKTHTSDFDVPESGSTMTLTEEQRQFLEKIKSDKEQTPIQLDGVPWNAEEPSFSLPSSHTSANSVPAENSLVEKNEQKQLKEPQNIEKSTTSSWILQCASFKQKASAETVKAKFAFEGIESTVTINQGLYRVVLGPYSTLSEANRSLKKAKASGHSGCILRSAGG